MYMCFKSWQHIKQFEVKEIEKEEKALELLNKRRLYKLFNFFKLGIVQSRVSYLNAKIVEIVYIKKMKLNIVIEWARRTHVDKSIKEKVIQMMNKSFMRMNKLQLDEYFNNLREEGGDRINEDLEQLIKERNHYKIYIKEEKIRLGKDISIKYPLILKLETQTFFDISFRKIEIDNNYFKSARNNFSLTPEKLRVKNRQGKIQQNNLANIIQAHKRQKSVDK